MTFRVALTFDAEHPDRRTRPGVTEELLGILADGRARATFFLQGRWVEAFPETARRIAADGHLVGNHSFYHARMPLLSARGFATDVRAAERVIVHATGSDPRPWFRVPFGTGAEDPAVVRRLAALGYRSVGWDIDSLDWYGRQTPERLEDEVVERSVEIGEGVIVLMHGWTLNAVGALPGVVRRLAAAGATFVGLDELPPERISPAVDERDVAGDLDHLIPA